MAIDISKSIFRKLAINGEVFSQGFFRTLKATYYRTALDLSDRYQHDAEMNGYPIDGIPKRISLNCFREQSPKLVKII